MMKPDDIGAMLFQHADVAEVYVTTYEMEGQSPTTYAFVAASDGAALDVDALKKYCRKQLGGVKTDLELLVVAEIPRNRAGTVDREQLRLLAGGSCRRDVA